MANFKNCMMRSFSFIQRFALCVTPLITSYSLAIAPSRAATFGYSEANLNFTNINTDPLVFLTDADGFTNVNGMANAFSFAQADASSFLQQASNSTFSEAFGEGRSYLGEAESQSRLIGLFFVDADQHFSFDFTAYLELETSIDNPLEENAIAFGEIDFELIDIDNSNVLDFFLLVGDIVTPDNSDFITFDKSDNITFTNSITTSNFGGIKENATASLQGSVQRHFANPTNLALIAFTRNQVVVVAVPEPSAKTGLLFGAILIGFTIKAKRKTISSPLHSTLAQ
ncbi:MAG: hypothetical protein KME59_26125 [Trichormus sp. ATA11-4-KO1]|jgi:hypothetical protein|nr:hypothetical protein [Trichormus sp. ATA11-4-KO1]